MILFLSSQIQLNFRFTIYLDVPWPLVNGVVLENSNLLQKAVCDAYTGVPPASCKAVQSSADGRCKN